MGLWLLLLLLVIFSTVQGLGTDSAPSCSFFVSLRIPLFFFFFSSPLHQILFVFTSSSPSPSSSLASSLHSFPFFSYHIISYFLLSINGAGASFPSVVYSSWMASYQEVRDNQVSLTSGDFQGKKCPCRRRIQNVPRSLGWNLFIQRQSLPSLQNFANKKRSTKQIRKIQ